MLLRCDTHLVDFVHPVAGKFEHQFSGLHCSRHGRRVQRARSRLKISWLWLLRAPCQLPPRKMASPLVLPFLWSRSVVALQERERPRAEFQRSAVAQVGAASSLSDTEAGSRCAWSIYTWRRGRQRDGGLRLGGILDHFNFTERQERQGGAEVAQRKSACARGG